MLNIEVQAKVEKILVLILTSSFILIILVKV